MSLDKLAAVMLASGIAACTALAIAAVPLFWHPRGDRLDAGLALVAFRDQWPDRVIEPPVEPIPNAVPFTPPLVLPPVEDARAVKVERIALVVAVPKAGPGIILPKEPKAAAPRDFCFPGRRVDHGRRWRCVYARGSRERR